MVMRNILELLLSLLEVSFPSQVTQDDQVDGVYLLVHPLSVLQSLLSWVQEPVIDEKRP